MNVGLFIPAFLGGKGGAEKVASQIADLIVKNGGVSTIICNPRPEGTMSYETRHNVSIREVHLNDDNKIRELKGEFDIIIGFAMSGFFKRIPEISYLLEIPFIIQECTNPVRMIATLFIHQQDGCRTLDDAFWLRQAVFSHAAAVRLTVPEYMNSVHPISRPFTYSFYNSFAPREPILDKPKEKIVITVGSLKTANKNGLEAVRSFLAFAQNNPEWKFQQFGKNKYQEKFQSLSNQLPTGVIKDCGIENDMSKIYSDASCLIIPSFEEGLPNVVVEAFTFGVPCIGFSDCHGVNHLIRDGENGYLVDREDPNSILEALQKITSNNRCFSMSENARKFAAENFKMEDFEEKWLKVISAALHKKDSSGNLKPPPAFSSGTTLEPIFRKMLGTELMDLN